MAGGRCRRGAACESLDGRRAAVLPVRQAHGPMARAQARHDQVGHRHRQMWVAIKAGAVSGRVAAGIDPGEPGRAVRRLGGRVAQPVKSVMVPPRNVTPIMVASKSLGSHPLPPFPGRISTADLGCCVLCMQTSNATFALPARVRMSFQAMLTVTCGRLNCNAPRANLCCEKCNPIFASMPDASVRPSLVRQATVDPAAAGRQAASGDRAWACQRTRQSGWSAPTCPACVCAPRDCRRLRHVRRRLRLRIRTGAQRHPRSCLHRRDRACRRVGCGARREIAPGAGPGAPAALAPFARNAGSRDTAP